MILLLTLSFLVMLWLGITILLLGGMWVLPSPLSASSLAMGSWGRCFLRGDNGVGGTLRIGAVMVGFGWWYRTAGLPLSPHIQNSLCLLLGIAALVAMFNAGRRATLTPIEEMVFCSALGAAWVVMLALGLYWLFFP
ncbi:hypothetical protein [Serratia quinivorans]|uniref:hypothetical protein n=1 Tax=Serratia quinivorans TaxID=137545 RepID=UPI00107EBF5C|nr:hypothetical protein [Serratia quinivorans]QBX68324.1 hypothetical protein E4343_20040 [Serratia quinivorans]